jgi:serine protease Do
MTVADLVERLKPAVVNISVTETVKPGKAPKEPPPLFGSDEFWKRFFGEREQKEFKRQGVGSGFIISNDGYIITNNHVIQKATDIAVILYNKKQFPARVVGTDPKTDVALIKIEAAEPLSVAPLGDSGLLREGEAVFAIGNPFGLAETVTAGIVSAKGRVIGAGPYDDFIQIDASINPGNSGGPLLNYYGEVVGINAVISSSGQGIGFAVPINLAKDVLVQLKEKGRVTRGWLGVSIQEVTPEIARSFGLKEPAGALVSDLVADGPAEKGGVRRGDVILEVNGKQVRDYHEIPRMIAAMSPGEKVLFTVMRDGNEVSVSPVVQEMKEDGPPSFGPESRAPLGMTLQPVTPDIARELGMKKAEGLVVAEVEQGSEAAEAGIQRGDVILQVNRGAANSLRDLADAAARGDRSVLLLIYRNGATFYLSVQRSTVK